jgi:hypothetical protein
MRQSARTASDIIEYYPVASERASRVYIEAVSTLRKGRHERDADHAPARAFDV